MPCETGQKAVRVLTISMLDSRCLSEAEVCLWRARHTLLILSVAKKRFLAARVGEDICKIGVEIALDCLGGYRYVCGAFALSIVVMKIYLV